MKVLYIVSGTGMSGGATKSFLRMMEGAITAGHTCYVICPNQGELYEYLKLRNIPVFSLHYVFNATTIAKSSFSKLVNWIKWQRRRFLNIRAANQLAAICRNIHPDILHTNSSIINIGSIVSKKLKIPHVMHMREYGDRDFNFSIHGLKAYTQTEKAFFIAITQSIFNYRHLSSVNARVIYNGICSENEIRFSPLKESYILYAGRIQETKGIRDLIESYILYAKRVIEPYRLKIAGNYEFEEGERLKKELSQVLEQYGYQDKVDWMGECEKIEDLMYKAIVTIVPSKNEGFGRVMPEAIANGCLVIGKNTAGTKEQMDNGLNFTGREIALRYDNIQGLSEQIFNIHSKGIEYYYPMIEAAQNTVKEMYTVEGYQKKIMNVYSEIIAKDEKGN